MTNEILIFAEEYKKNNVNENLESGDITNFVKELEIEGLINFSVEERTNENGDWWLQLEYYSNKLQKTIIFDYDFCEKYDTIDELAKDIIEYKNKIDILESKSNKMTNETMEKVKAKKRLEYLRQEIEAERISYQEIAELQSLADHIDKNDTLLLQWAGVKENEPDNMEKLKDHLLTEALNFINNSDSITLNNEEAQKMEEKAREILNLFNN